MPVRIVDYVLARSAAWLARPEGFEPPTPRFVVLRSADTEGLKAGGYYHEAQVTLSDGTVGTVLGGAFKVRANLIAPR
jgi:hypothetical protein